MFYCTANEFERIVRLRGLIDRNADGVAYDLQLSTCGGTINVNRDEQRLSLLIIAKPTRDLAGRCRLTRTLQADDHNDVRRLPRKNEPRRRSAHKSGKLVVNDLYDLFVRF